LRVCVYLEELFKAEYFHIAWFDRRQRLKKKLKKRSFLIFVFLLLSLLFSLALPFVVSQNTLTLCVVCGNFIAGCRTGKWMLCQQLCEHLNLQGEFVFSFLLQSVKFGQICSFVLIVLMCIIYRCCFSGYVFIFCYSFSFFY